MRSVLVLFLLTVTPLAIALDCRKFSFAPACRGIMLKRADVGESSQELDNLSSQLETLSWILHQAEADGIKHCVPISWIKQKLATSWLAAGRA